MAELTTKEIRRLLKEKYPTEPDTAEHVWASILVALSQKIDNMGRQLKELIAAAQALAAMLAPQQKAEPQAEPGVPRDQTPFPAGASTTPATTTVPSADVASSPAMNASPIPAKPNNGQKTV